MPALGAQLLGAFLTLVGPGDVGEEVVWENGRSIKRWPEQHARRLLTVFGELGIARRAYGTRPGRKIELAPTDQRLQLPESALSYLLQEWDRMRFSSTCAMTRPCAAAWPTVVHLSDGQHALETDRRKHLPLDAHAADVFDLMHVLPRLWEAAHVFHREGSEAASQFVRERLHGVLEGEAGRVIGGLRQMGTKHGLRGPHRVRLRRLCEFRENNLHRMRYDDCLRAGCPIAAGVSEGACRHVIKDRMERAGMRGKVPGAQAMLQLRAIHANGDWRAFQDDRIKHKTARLYPYARILPKITWNLAL